MRRLLPGGHKERLFESVEAAVNAAEGLNAEEAESLLKGLPEVWIANYNSPGQIVISGTRVGVSEAIAHLKTANFARVIPLQVQGAFHSPLMISAQEMLAPHIEIAPIERPHTTLVMNVPGDCVDLVVDIRRHLIAQVTHSVRWEQSVRAMMRDGADSYLEIGSGKTLSGLNRKIGAAPTYSLDKVQDMETLYASLSQ